MGGYPLGPGARPRRRGHCGSAGLFLRRVLWPAHDRVSAFAGVSTPLGWGGHESQWRGGSPALLAQLGPRGEDINRLYSTTSPTEATAILDRYAIGWVYVGLFERDGYGTSDCKVGGHYPADGLAKFDSLMDRAFVSQDGQVAIYRRK